MALKAGDQCPNFTLPDQEGKSVSIQNFLGKSHLIIYFYPKDNTAGCTAQACSFRDAYEDLIELGTQVVGISSDNTQSHALFADKYRLPYPLLSDENGDVRKLFGVPTNLFGLIPGRVTYIVNKAGGIVEVINSQVNIGLHIKRAKEVLKKL
jgi:thioredoxin-dependent peroxiredoxin